MNAPKLLVVDDGDRYVELFHALMRGYRYATRCELPGPCWECTHRPGCALTHAHDWAETEAMLRRHRDLDAVLLDVRFDLPASRLLPAGEGLDLDARQRSEGLRILERIRGMRRDLPVVLMTGESDLDLSERKWLTADEYLSFAGDAAFDVRALSLLIERVARRARAEDDSYVWGETSAMAKLRRDAAALARTSLPVLVLGETGTGKSALARAALHRRGTPFVAVDLSAVPENLMAAELFGTVPGAFSGAVTRAGRFEEASGGTLFLDEVGNLTLAAQRMLLLALQDGAITRLGESRSRPARVKVVAATNAKLERSVAEGMFRADLYARLNPAAALRLPPLRERTADLPALAGALLTRRFVDGPDRELLLAYATLCGMRGDCIALDWNEGAAPASEGIVFVLPKGAAQRLRAHGWFGNVREFEFLLATACSMTLADALAAAEAGRASPDPRLPISGRLLDGLLAAEVPAGPADPPADVSQQPSPPLPSAVLINEPLSAKARLRDVAAELERRHLKALFLQTGGDFSAMAAVLLTGDREAAERRLRNRFQQLGLRIRELRKML